MPAFEARSPKEFGAAVKHVRTGRGLTQEQLAEELGIPRLYLASLESGTPTLWATRMFRTLRRLGIRVTISYDVPAGSTGA
ncbi:helix-turn-helix transcriptional regulator [Pseudarthrobacter raffinosi]|uniref:helix-turn-helix transcriptional regulator n=1 Tax=Pseudarthrobacter raffinosi TaxID=2953651 RepID=UPI00208DE951|nr:helix-turn-helix domain-containing protein [Pseudarthrobacter sp. MDT3-26]MCO4264055.1 helix-turn-helix domain-containing protein [Pseudarthrobacter sp. MDT3-26]